MVKIILFLCIIIICIIISNLINENYNNNLPNIIWINNRNKDAWETDYILNNILKNKYRKQIFDINDNILNNNINNNIIVFSSNNISYNKILEI